MTKPNPARGESSVTIDGHTYLLRASFNNMATFQAAINVEGLPALLRLLQMLDPRAVKAGIECLAVEGNVDALGEANFFAHMTAAQAAILDAISGGIEQDKSAGNAEGATEQAA